MLDVIAGYDEQDPSSADVPVPNYSSAFKARASKLRLAIPRTPYFDGLDPEIAKAMDTAIEVLRKLTATTGEITLPSEGIPLDAIYTKVRSIEAYTYHAQWIAESPEKYQAATRQRITKNAAEVTTPVYVQARRQLDSLRRESTRIFGSVDLLVTPTLPSPPVLITQGRVLVRSAFAILRPSTCWGSRRSLFLAVSRPEDCRLAFRSSVLRSRS